MPDYREDRSAKERWILVLKATSILSYDLLICQAGAKSSAFVRDERPAGYTTPPAVWLTYSVDRKGEHPRRHLKDFKGERPHVIPQNAPRAEVRTDVGTFVGTRNVAFPELGQRNIQVFTGVEEELFANLAEGNPRAQEVAQNDQVRFRGERQRVRRDSPFSSISPNGTCMIVEGL